LTGKKEIILRLILMVLRSTVPFGIAWFRFYMNQVYPVPLDMSFNWVIVGIYAIFNAIVTYRYARMWIDLHSLKDLICSQVLATLISDLVIYIVLALLIRNLPSIPVMLITLGFQVGLIVVGSLASEILRPMKDES